MNPLLAQLDDLKSQWLAAQPLPDARDAELRKKFRLEWNYNSNHIEGNTLTYAETELLIIMGQTKGEHSIREYDEMKAHDLAVAKITEMAAARDVLREADIRGLNKLILKEPYLAEAITAQGQITSVEIIPGEYKRLPNNVKSPTGESILFASPTDTPACMAELVQWMLGELEAPKLHAVDFAAQLHHRFLKIHPFADGNGRVARLLANFVVMREGFPPLIVKSRDKANYIAALRMADVGESDRLTDYFAREMQWSLEMALRAARGESIEEPGDAEKEVAVFIKQHEGEQAEVSICSVEAIAKSLDNGLRMLLRRLKEKLMTLAPLFQHHEVKRRRRPHKYFGEEWDAILTDEIERKSSGALVMFGISFVGYNRPTSIPFDRDVQIYMHCEHGLYRIEFDGLKVVKRYGEAISSEEIEAFTDRVLKGIFAGIKEEVGHA